MGRTKTIRKQILGLQKVVAEHHDKIQQELNKPHPDYRLIEYWAKEIRSRQAEIAKKEAKLPGRKT